MDSVISTLIKRIQELTDLMGQYEQCESTSIEAVEKWRTAIRRTHNEITEHREVLEKLKNE